MEKLDINLDEDFKNINTNISSNNDSIGIDLLIGGNSSPKSNMSDDVKSVKTDISDSHSFFKDEQADDKRVPSPMNDPIMNNIVPDEYKPVHVLSQTEIKNEKIDLLYKFSKLQNQGTRTSTNYNMNSNLDEMRNEYIKLKKQRDTSNSVKFQRKILMAAVSGAEFLNSKFDPFDVKLDGWSESVNESVEDFDEVFSMIPANKKMNYDKNYISDLYTEYMTTNIGNDKHKDELYKALIGKEVLLIAPGKSSQTEVEKIKEFVSENNVIIIEIGRAHV
jgi:hypothetical protein